MPPSPPRQKPRQYSRQKTFQGPKKSLKQSGKPAQRQDLLCHQNTHEDASTKSSKVLNFNSQSAQNHNINKIKSSARESASSHLVLPDPSQPPPDQDNTSLWIAVMSQKDKDSRKNRAVNPRPQAPTTIAPSAGARGTSDYENFLIKLLGNELEHDPQYRAGGPDDHFPLESQHPSIEKYVRMHEGMEAMDCANAMKGFPESNPNEYQLSDFITERMFCAPWSLEPKPLTNGQPQMAFDQKAIVKKREYTSIFYNYSISEIRSGLADIRHVRLSPNERLEGLSTANTPNLLPAATDLRGRCDMVFGINHKCLHPQSRRHNTYLPCYDPSAGVCCIWLRAEFKVKAEPKYIKAALHQWAAGAYLELSSRVRLARDENRESFLSDPESIKDLRQYGYIICGENVDIWEMCVTKHQDLRPDGKRRDTDYFESYIKFPTKKLKTLELIYPDEVTQFCQWHAKIMDWGFNVYSREYLGNVDRLRRSRLPGKEWALRYEDAVGKPLPSLPEEDPESSQETNTQIVAENEAMTTEVQMSTSSKPRTAGISAVKRQASGPVTRSKTAGNNVKDLDNAPQLVKECDEGLGLGSELSSDPPRKPGPQKFTPASKLPVPRKHVTALPPSSAKETSQSDPPRKPGRPRKLLPGRKLLTSATPATPPSGASSRELRAKATAPPQASQSQAPKPSSTERKAIAVVLPSASAVPAQQSRKRKYLADQVRRTHTHAFQP